MAIRVHMQDQVKNRIESIMRDDRLPTFGDYVQTALTLLIVFIFLMFGLNF